MKKSWLLRFGVLMAIVSVGLGLTSASANPCDADVETFCGTQQPGDSNIGNCMESNMDKLSSPCREWIKKTDKSLKQLKQACSWAARDFCRDVQPGYQRVKTCLMNNMDKLPLDCQNALKAL